MLDWDPQRRHVENGNKKRNCHNFVCNIIQRIFWETRIFFWPGCSEPEMSDFKDVSFCRVCLGKVPAINNCYNLNGTNIICTEHRCNVRRVSHYRSTTDIKRAECFQQLSYKMQMI